MAGRIIDSIRGNKEPLLPSKAASEDGYISDLETSPQISFLDRPVPATANPIASDTHRRVEFRNDIRHHPDRGAGYYEYSRERYSRASLVETGRYARLLAKAIQTCNNFCSQEMWNFMIRTYKKEFHRCIKSSEETQIL